MYKTFFFQSLHDKSQVYKMREIFNSKSRSQTLASPLGSDSMIEPVTIFCASISLSVEWKCKNLSGFINLVLKYYKHLNKQISDEKVLCYYFCRFSENSELIF